MGHPLVSCIRAYCESPLCCRLKLSSLRSGHLRDEQPCRTLCHKGIIRPTDAAATGPFVIRRRTRLPLVLARGCHGMPSRHDRRGPVILGRRAPAGLEGVIAASPGR